MTDKKRIGIIQSRGLGDIVIALPIAHYYHQQGYEVYWPICQPFLSSFRNSVPWVNWLSVPVDSVGHFFLDVPLRLLKQQGIHDEDDILYLYQYLNSVPEKTDPDLFAMMKFDQYKYASVGLPFHLKWNLSQCISRDKKREKNLYKRVVKQPRYMVYQEKASDISYSWDLSWLDPDVQQIEITELTDSIWDWLSVIEGAETLILIDSVFANIVDQMNLNPTADKYYARKWDRSVDGNPVLLQNWQWITVEPPKGKKVTSLTDLLGKTKQ